MRTRKAAHQVARIASLSGLLALAVSFIVFAQSGQTQQPQGPPLQGGVSQTDQQQPTTETYNSQGADSEYACFDAALCFQGLMDETQRAIEHAMSTKDPEWHKPESCARNPVWQNLNPSACWQYLTKARNLAEQNDSANSYSLQQQAQAALDQAHQCFDPIYQRWGALGGSYNDPNWNCGKGSPPSPQPPTGQTNTRPTTTSVGSGTSRGKWTSAIVQSCPGGGPGTHGALPGTGGIAGPACIMCFWRDANGYPAAHPQIIPAPAFIKSSFDPPGAALKECGDKLTPGNETVRGPTRLKGRVEENGGGGGGNNGLPLPSANSTPPPPSFDYLRGMGDGFHQCIQQGLDALGAAASMARGDFVTAAQLLGLEPGESVVLRGIYQELATQQVNLDPQTGKPRGISPYDAGLLAARRLCNYAIVPSVTKAAGTALKAIRTRGATPLNPLRGQEIPQNSKYLTNKWILTKKGPTKLGPLKGAGVFGSVYELPNQPGQVIKISNAHPGSGPSFQGQVAGAKTLQSNPPVPTPSILDSQFGAGADPSFLWMDNVYSKWPGAQMVDEVAQLTKAQVEAVQQLHKTIAAGGRIWADGHLGNIFFLDLGGQTLAGVLDSDMVINASDVLNKDLPAVVGNNVFHLLETAGTQRLLFPPQAGPIMQSFFWSRFGSGLGMPKPFQTSP